MLWGWIAGLCFSSSTRALMSLLQSWFIGSQYLACTGAWDYSCPDAWLFICRCWTSWDFCHSFFQLPVVVYLNSSPTLQHPDCSPVFSIVCKVRWSALHAIIQVFSKGISQWWLKYWSLRGSTTCKLDFYQLHIVVKITTLQARWSSQFSG